MKIKNKNILELVKILDKYLKQNEKVKIENVEIYKEYSDDINHIYIIYDEDKENTYDLYYEKLSTNKLGLFYYKYEHLFCYLFKDLEQETDNKAVLRVYETLLNLKVTKIMNF